MIQYMARGAKQDPSRPVLLLLLQGMQGMQGEARAQHCCLILKVKSLESESKSHSLLDSMLAYELACVRITSWLAGRLR